MASSSVEIGGYQQFDVVGPGRGPVDDRSPVHGRIENGPPEIRVTTFTCRAEALERHDRCAGCNSGDADTVAREGSDRPGDVRTVMRVLYLVFNEGYSGDIDLAADQITVRTHSEEAAAVRTIAEVVELPLRRDPSVLRNNRPTLVLGHALQVLLKQVQVDYLH